MKTIALIILTLYFSNSIAETPTLTFGVVPQQSATKLAEKWIPVLRHLSSETGLNIVFKTAPNIPSFEKRLANGSYDIAYMNPYHFTVFNQSPGYRAVSKARSKKLKGIMVVHKDYTADSFDPSETVRLAFPSPAAFAASILTQSKLSHNNIDFSKNYVSSHDSVYRAVAKKLYAGGGGVLRTFNSLDPAIRSELKILWTTEGFTPHAIAVHPRVDEATKHLLELALINMENSVKGPVLLDSLKLKGFEAAKNSDWDDVRNLNINLLSDLIQ